MPQFSQITRKDRHNPSRGLIRCKQDNRLSSSGHFSRQIAQEDEAAQHSSEESTVPEKHIPPPGFSLANIRILPDSGQLRGYANPRWAPRNRLPTIWPVQAKLAINQPGDRYEQEADRVAEQVMRMPEPGIVNRSEMAQPPLMRRSCPKCRKNASERQENDEERLQMKPTCRITPESSAAQAPPSPVPPIVHEVLRSPGRPLDPATRSFMEPRFGHDFSRVRVHEDARAAESARAMNARAYTVGHEIVFGSGEHISGDAPERRLIAHELAHVLQQNSQVNKGMIQRSSSEFCTPYGTADEASSTEAWLRSYFLPLMGAKFGGEVRDLWESYLSRAPGDSLTPRVFATPGNPIEESFATSRSTDNDQDDVLSIVIDRVNLFPGGRLNPHVHTVSSLRNYLSPAEMDNRPIDYSNPLSKAGNIAGGIGSSDAGQDYRKITSANVAMEKVPLIGDSGYIVFTLIPNYEVFDAVDFCDGQSGSPLEEIFTIPLSRLEASGEAYDVPYIVRFRPEPRTNREFYSRFPI